MDNEKVASELLKMASSLVSYEEVHTAKKVVTITPDGILHAMNQRVDLTMKSIEKHKKIIDESKDVMDELMKEMKEFMKLEDKLARDDLYGAHKILRKMHPDSLNKLSVVMNYINNNI